MLRIARIAVAAVLVLVFLSFWLMPSSERTNLLTSIGLGITALGVILLSLMSYRAWRTWRRLGLLLVLHGAAQLWLQWRWDLWDSPVVLIRNLNVVAALAAWATLVAVTMSLVLLLVFRDASVIGLAVAWVGWPMLLIATTLHFHTAEALNDLPLREGMVWVVPVCLLSFLTIAGLGAFVVHLVWSITKEAAGRELVEQI